MSGMTEKKKKEFWDTMWFAWGVIALPIVLIVGLVCSIFRKGKEAMEFETLEQSNARLEEAWAFRRKLQKRVKTEVGLDETCIMPYVEHGDLDRDWDGHTWCYCDMAKNKYFTDLVFRTKACGYCTKEYNYGLDAKKEYEEMHLLKFKKYPALFDTFLISPRDRVYY